jgi:thioredoxin 1
MKLLKSTISLLLLVALVACSGKKNSANDSVSESSAVDTEVVVEDSISSEALNDSLPTVVDFFATWCGPCKKMDPIVEQLKEEYAGKVNFVSIDVDKYPYDAQRFGVDAMPTFVFLNADGDEVDRVVGADPMALKQNVAHLAELADLVD